LYDNNDKRRSYEEARELYGKRAFTYSRLFEELSSLKNMPRPLSTPMRIFISYRWGNEQENKWVYELSELLKNRGYIVYLDKLIAKEDPKVDVFTIVNKMALSHMVLLIIDPKYIERIGKESDSQIVDGIKFHPHHEKGWAYNEWIIAKSLSNIVKLSIMGLLRKGSQLIRGMKLITETEAGNTYDVRDRNIFMWVLNHYFPNLELSIPNEKIKEAEHLFFKSELLSQQNDLQNAIAYAERGLEIAPFVSNGYERLSILNLRTYQYDGAFGYASEAIKISSVPSHTNYLLAQAAVLSKNYDIAIRFARRFLEFNNPNWQMELILFQTFFEIGRFEDAMICLENACKVRPDYIELFSEYIMQNKLLLKDRCILPLMEIDGDYIVTTSEKDGSDLFWATIKLPIDKVPGRKGMREIDQVVFAMSALTYHNYISRL
jgi:tetratricopeptide (TPR) repeat protein